MVDRDRTGAIHGVRCQGCGTTESDCAWNGCECCAACTHTFDGGETRKYLCFGCNRIITHHTHKLPETGLCPYCVLRRNAGIPLGERPACVPSPQECEQPLPEPEKPEPTPPRPNLVHAMIADDGIHHWYVSYSGMAHLWGAGARMAYCGMVRGPAYGPPSPDWEVKCKRCANAWYWKTERAESA